MFSKRFLNTLRNPEGMQVVILCGGKGTRLSELTEEIPKPLVQVGDKPVLHHLMDIYARFGHKDFILCLGYKGEKIREYFKNTEWNIDFVDTGEDSNKAERLMKIKSRIQEDNFLLSYGDDLSDVDINKVIELHKEKNKIITLTAVQLQSPFGILGVDYREKVVSEFKEKPTLKQLMNGGFYVVNKKIFDFIKPNHDLEKETFDNLAKERQIVYFEHNGFWKSMNTLKDVIELNEDYKEGRGLWKK